MVPESRGDTTRDVWTIGQAALGPVSLVRGAGGNRASSRAGLLNAGSRSPARAGSVDDLTGVAAQCRHSKRRSGVSRDDGAMACRASRSPAKGSDGGDLPLTQIGRQSTPSRTGFESLEPHQTLNPMQSTRHTLRQHVVPHPPGAIGSVARKEAGANLRAHLLIAPATLTARSCQPGIEPTPRDTERLAQPFRRPDPPVLRKLASGKRLEFGVARS